MDTGASERRRDGCPAGMRLKQIIAFGILAAWLTAAPLGFAMDGAGIARLKRAGVGDATIELIVKERILETAAFTVEDILAMKAAGIGEAALQTLMREGSFMKDRGPVVYGRDLRSMRLATVEDIVRLKQAGVSDEVLQAIVAASRRGADNERDQALRRLQETGVWVDFPR
jgi:hypothetical protein